VDGLNVRKEPSTEAKKVTVIYKNEVYPVVKVKDDWIEIKISDENINGYVKKEFADVLVDFKEAVSKEEEQKLKQLAAEEKAKKETEVVYANGVSYTKDDLRLLTCLIHAEAGSQSYEGKLAVANIVLNRVKSSKYPDSIKAVIYSPGQFSVASSGSLQKQLDRYGSFNSKSQLLSVKAAKDALEGANNIGSRLYFHSYGAAVRKGYDDKSTSVKIGGLLFW
jgi:spore germination cell wall hydrolase CwlJ-like protein